MERSDFFRTCACLMLSAPALQAFGSTQDDRTAAEIQLAGERDFIAGWLNDLLSTANTSLDRETMVKLIEGCGKGCYARHKFKQDLAVAGKGSVKNLVEAYKKNFEAWEEGNKVHIRYGEVSKQCYCPVAKQLPVHEDDLMCECTRATHQTVFETALGRPVKAIVAESLRRGGKTCHFILTV